MTNTQKAHFYFTNRSISPLLIRGVQETLQGTRDPKILDLGCGDGVMITDLKNSKAYKNRVSLHAIDISDHNIRFAKSHHKTYNIIIGSIYAFS